MVKSVAYGLLFLLVAAYADADDESTKQGKTRSVQWGVGAGGQYLNDYRGSEEAQFNMLPFPIILYDGDILKIDEEEGARLTFLQGERFELNLSADSALRNSSDNNKKRAGMPELDAAFQLGPSLNVLLGGNGFDDGLLLRIPIRAVTSVNTNDFGMDYIGYTVSPEITYKKPDFFKGWNAKLAAGPIYASSQYHDYYYSVDAEYATLERPAYTATSGYSGAFFEAGMFRWRGAWLFQLGLRYDKLSGAKFMDSPLVETDDYYSFVFALGWLFGESRF